jgi:hypothetical protein
MKTLAVALSVACTCLLLAPRILAEPLALEDSDTAQAAVRFQRGVELYREGSYEGALAEFRKAYQLSPSYRVLYNIAQAQYALHDFVGAYKSIMQYVSEGGGAITAERRAQVDEMSAKLEERIAHVQVVTNVVGADVRVDNVSVGTSPLPGLVPVNVGTRRVSVLKAGLPETVRLVTLAGKETAKVELTVEDGAGAAAVVPRNMAPSPAAAPSSERAPASVGASLSARPAAALTKAPAAPSHAGLAISLTTTAALAVGTGVFGYLAYKAQGDLEDQVKTFPNTQSRIEDARTKSKTYGYIADAFGAATVLSAGVAIYFAATHDSGSPRAKPSAAKDSLVVAPTLGGMVVQGSF